MSIPYPGEQICGDGWVYHNSPGRMLAMIVDGLGHGWAAAEAAQEAIATFHAKAEATSTDILSHIHDALRKTRGAVAGIAEIRLAERSMTFAGVGNISAVLLSSAKSQSLVSHNGTLGSIATRIQAFRAEWRPDSLQILNSDVLKTRWYL